MLKTRTNLDLLRCWKITSIYLRKLDNIVKIKKREKKTNTCMKNRNQISTIQLYIRKKINKKEKPKSPTCHLFGDMMIIDREHCKGTLLHYHVIHYVTWQEVKSCLMGWTFCPCSDVTKVTLKSAWRLTDWPTDRPRMWIKF